MDEVIDAYRCLECGAITEESAGSLYECGRCGTIYTQEGSADGASNRCPTDNIFGAKLSDDGCPECGQGEMEQVRAVMLNGGNDLIVVEGDEPDTVLIARARAQQAEYERQEAEAEATRQRLQEAKHDEFVALPKLKASEVLPGDLLVYHDPGSSWNQYPEYRVGRVSVEEDAIRLAPPGGMGINLRCDPDEIFGLKERPEVTPPNEQSLEERLRGEGPVTRYG